MKRISSAFSFFYKKLFWHVVFLSLTVFIFNLAIRYYPEEVKKLKLNDLTYFIPIYLVVSFFIYKTQYRLNFGIADSVFDLGNRLLIYLGGEHETIPLTQITRLRLDHNVLHRSIKISFQRKGLYCYEIQFYPKVTLREFLSGECFLAKDLVIRIEEALKNESQGRKIEVK
jgi:hypothetical protein